MSDTDTKAILEKLEWAIEVASREEAVGLPVKENTAIHLTPDECVATRSALLERGTLKANLKVASDAIIALHAERDTQKARAEKAEAELEASRELRGLAREFVQDSSFEGMLKNAALAYAERKGKEGK